MRHDGRHSRTKLAPLASEHFERRQADLLAEAAARGLDGVVVWSRGGTNADTHGDVLYLTNHLSATSHIPDRENGSLSGHCALVLRSGYGSVLVTDGYDASPADVVADELRIELHVAGGTVAAARDLGLAGKRLGLVGRRSLLQPAYEALADGIQAREIVWLDDAMVRLRSVKSADEIALLRDASRIGVEWTEVMLDALEPGRTDAEVVGAGLAYFAAAERWPMDVAIASGPNASRYRSRQALPTWDSERELTRGDLVHFDVWGPAAHGYYCDIARTTVVGAEPSPAQEELLEDARALVMALVEHVRVGNSFADIYQAGTEYLAGRGGPASEFAKLGFYGHSLGLEVEAPLIVFGETAPVVPGMVLALESFLAVDGVGGAGYEHIVAVGEDGVELLTDGAPDRPWRDASP